MHTYVCLTLHLGSMEKHKELDILIRTPARILLAGPAGVGKSSFVGKLLAKQNEVFSSPPVYTFYFYNVYQPLFDSFHNVNEFIEGTPTTDFIKNRCQWGSLIILDDQQLNISKDLALIFSAVARHYGVSIILLTQTLFDPKNPYFRIVSLNANYLILFKNSRDRTGIRTLSNQIAAAEPKEIVEAYNRATKSNPYSYLLIDLHPESPDHLRLRTNILHEGGFPVKSFQPSI